MKRRGGTVGLPTTGVVTPSIAAVACAAGSGVTGENAVRNADMQLQFATDEAAHLLLIEAPGGVRRMVGGPGSGAGEFRYPRGLCTVEGATPAETRVFVCDAWNHRVQVFDGDGQVQFGFGGSGSGTGQFDVPSDICLIAPRFAGEDAGAGIDTRLLAVADRWNCRIQIFTLDGVPLGSIGRARGAAEEPGPPNISRAGWPFFHQGAQPILSFPTHVSWRDPWLDVTCAGGRIVSIDVAAALLPDFTSWLGSATECELSEARQALAPAGAAGAMVDTATLEAIDRAVRAARTPLRIAS